MITKSVSNNIAIWCKYNQFEQKHLLCFLNSSSCVTDLLVFCVLQLLVQRFFCMFQPTTRSAFARPRSPSTSTPSTRSWTTGSPVSSVTTQSISLPTKTTTFVSNGKSIKSDQEQPIVQRKSHFRKPCQIKTPYCITAILYRRKT